MVNNRLFPEKSAKELLVQFRETGSQEPYEEIVRRYAAMVYGVCLRVTGDKHDAEDATQAVFLSLALQAKTSREITYVGPWLQKVAHRLALDVKKAKTRRKKREDKLADIARHNGNGHPGHNGDNGSANGFFGGKPHPNPADHPGHEELKAIMMEELNKLPAKYRMPLVLHYFGGLSREEMAAELLCNPSTLGVRVHRGKTMLGKRLAKRGVAISAVAMAVLLEHVVRHSTVQPLISTASGASAAASGLVASANFGAFEIASASARVIAIARTALRSIIYAKAKVTLSIILMVVTAAVTTGSVVAKYSDMKVPLLDIRQWLRPLLESLMPSPRVDATPTDVESSIDAPPAPSMPPLAIKVDLDKLGLGNVTPPKYIEDAAPSAMTLNVSSAKGQASAIAVGEAPIQSITRAPIGSPIRLPTPVAPTLAPRIAVSDAKKSSSKNDPETKEEVDPSKELLTASADGEFSLIGAGGGGGFGTTEVYVMPANSTLHSTSMTIGESGRAVFKQSSGTNAVAGTLTLGKQKSAVGIYEQTGGTLTAHSEVIGDEGQGTFITTSGINVARDSITVGKSGVGTLVACGDSKVVVVNANPKSDPTTDPGGLHLGQNPGSIGTLSFSDTASISADPQLIGVAGNGLVLQSGGTNSTGAVVIASFDGSQGTYNLDAGDLIIKPRPTDKPEAAIKIGGAGKGDFKFGNAQSTGKVYEVGGTGGSVVVRGQPRGDGSLVGYGKIDLTGVLSDNGQIVADGYRKERTLDLSSFVSVTSTIENPRWGGTNGWFARRKGRLLLPPIHAQPGDGIYTWGEDESDPMIDLVNSARFSIEGAQQAGDVSIALLSPLRDDIPRLPGGHRFIGIWSFDATALGEFDGMDLQVRYDDAMARELELDENILKLWVYDTGDQQWNRINDESFTRNTLDHLLSGHTSGDDVGYFAVSAPEPAGMMLLVLSAGAALMRRRRGS